MTIRSATALINRLNTVGGLFQFALGWQLPETFPQGAVKPDPSVAWQRIMDTPWGCQWQIVHSSGGETPCGKGWGETMENNTVLKNPAWFGHTWATSECSREDQHVSMVYHALESYITNHPQQVSALSHPFCLISTIWGFLLHLFLTWHRSRKDSLLWTLWRK